MGPGGRSPVRIMLACILAGGGLMPLFLAGIQELRFSGAAVEPVPVDLASVEAGTLPADRHVRIGDHLALYQAVAVWMSASADVSDPGTVIDIAWYPIYSVGHPLVRQLRSQGLSVDAVEDMAKAELPALKDFAVLVETRRFKSLGAIPGKGLWAASLQGLRARDFGALPPDQKRFLEASYPGIDTSRVLLVEEGVVPVPPSQVRSLEIFGGFMLMVALLVLLPAPKISLAPPPLPSAGSVVRTLGKLTAAFMLGLVAFASGMLTWTDLRLFQECAPTPVAAELRGIERGAGVPNPHVRLGKHVALFPAAVAKGRLDGGTDPGAKAGVVYVPLVSPEHPAAALAGAGQPVPQGVAVMLKTRAYATLGEIPTGAQPAEARAGLVMGTAADSISHRADLARGMPGADLGKVLVFEEGRPPPVWWELVVGLLFTLACAAGSAWFLVFY